MDDDISFEDAVEYAERAGTSAALRLVLEMLKDAVEANRRLSERVAVLEHELGSQVGGPPSTPWVQPNTYPIPTRYDYNTVYNSNSIGSDIVSNIDALLGEPDSHGIDVSS